MLRDSQSLGGAGKVVSDGKSFDLTWVPIKSGHIDGVLVVAGDSRHSVTKASNQALGTLDHMVHEVTNIFGHTRPGAEDR